jgi:hypothetical protein
MMRFISVSNLYLKRIGPCRETLRRPPWRYDFPYIHLFVRTSRYATGPKSHSTFLLTAKYENRDTTAQGAFPVLFRSIF